MVVYTEEDIRKLLDELKKTPCESGCQLNLNIDPQKMAEHLKRSEEVGKAYQIERKKMWDSFCAKQVPFLERNIGKVFEISQEFYNSALDALKTCFRVGQERAMMAFFEERDGQILLKEFYNHRQTEKESYCFYAGSIITTEQNGKKGYASAMAHNVEKIIELTGKRKEMFVLFHTHPSLCQPSEGDLKSLYCAIIGFQNQTESLEKLLDLTFRKPPEYIKKIATIEDFKKSPEVSEEKFNEELNSVLGKKIMIQKHYDFPEELYKKVCEENRPTIRIFYNEGGRLQTVPICLNGVCLG